MSKVVLAIVFVLFSISANAVSMQELFNGLKKQPRSAVDRFMQKGAEISLKKAKSAFYPKLYGSASYEHYNIPTSLVPVTPTDSAYLLKTGASLPFSKNIYQISAKVNIPLFVYPLFSLSKKAQQMVNSARQKRRLNFISNEAAVVTLNAKLTYIEMLIKSVKARKASLESELKIVKKGVEVGRTPKIQLLKIKNAIDQMNTNLEQLKSSKVKLIWSIYALTGIKLKNAVSMTPKGNIKKGVLLPLQPLRYALRASLYEIDAQKGKLYPSVYLSGFVARKFASSYNTDNSVVKNYGSIGIYVQIPIFDKTVYTDIQKAESDYIKNKYQLKELSIQLKSDEKSLNADLNSLDVSVKDAESSVANYKRLLKYAKVAFEMKRMTEEEYLRYESELLNAQATLYELKSKRWEDISKLAVIYGNNLEEIVK